MIIEDHLVHDLDDSYSYSSFLCLVDDIKLILKKILVILNKISMVNKKHQNKTSR